MSDKYNIKAYNKKEKKAFYTNERLGYGSMQKAMNDCFESGAVKVVVTTS